ncbi:hypothetical protein GCM10020254_09790 [Streptomyces goshikiensis]
MCFVSEPGSGFRCGSGVVFGLGFVSEPGSWPRCGAVFGCGLGGGTVPAAGRTATSRRVQRCHQW